jgi:oligoribonuclease (3'-5' exoribonuclease)
MFLRNVVTGNSIENTHSFQTAVYQTLKNLFFYFTPDCRATTIFAKKNWNVEISSGCYLRA